MFVASIADVGIERCLFGVARLIQKYWHLGGIADLGVDVKRTLKSGAMTMRQRAHIVGAVQDAQGLKTLTQCFVATFAKD